MAFNREQKQWNTFFVVAITKKQNFVFYIYNMYVHYKGH